MAYEVPGYAFSRVADVAVGIPQYTAVVIDDAEGLAVATAAEAIDGIVQMPVMDDVVEAVRVMKSGISFAIASEAITEGDELEVDANGEMSVLAAGVKVATALTGGAENELISVLLV